MRGEIIDCRELVGMAKAKRLAGRNWRNIRDDLVFYIRGKGLEPRVTGSGSEYSFVFPNGHVFYHRGDGDYGCNVPEDTNPAQETPTRRRSLRQVAE